jgi:hypothetical protein
MEKVFPLPRLGRGQFKLLMAGGKKRRLCVDKLSPEMASGGQLSSAFFDLKRVPLGFLIISSGARSVL